MLINEKKYLTGTREINPAFTLHKIGEYASFKVQNTDVGKQLEIVTALLMCGLTLEALLNDIGYSMFVLKANEIELWNAVERLSPKKKLDAIAERLNLKIDYGCKPFQYFSKIFKYRDYLVHGKYKKIEKHRVEIKEIEISYLEDIECFKDEWEKETIEENIDKWRKTVSDIADILTEKAELNNILHLADFQSWSLF